VSLTRLATLSREMYERALVTQAAYDSARAMAVRTDSSSAMRARLDSLAPPPVTEGRGFGFGRRGARNTPPTLESAVSSLMAAAMAMQGAETAPTAAEIAACDHARAESESVLAKWRAMRSAGRAKR